MIENFFENLKIMLAVLTFVSGGWYAIDTKINAMEERVMSIRQQDFQQMIQRLDRVEQKIDNILLRK